MPHRANGPGPAPRSGTSPVMPRVPEEGKLRANSRERGPPHRGLGPPASIRTSHARRTNIPPGGVRRRHVSRRRGRGSSTGRLAHPPHSMWVIEACSAAAARGADFVSPHCRPRITKVHSEAACAVCLINWIRRHDAFPSSRLRRKLHGPISYVAGDAASYARRRFDKTAPGHDERGIPGAGKEIQL